MLNRFIHRTKFAAIAILLVSGHFSQNALQSSNQGEEVQDIIRKTDSILVSQHRPLDYNEKQKIVKEIYSDVLTSVKDEVRNYIRNSRFNGTVAIAKDGVVIYQENFGYADMKKQIPVTDTSKFQLASVSKQFTAAAVLKLYQEGKINLDSSLTTYIPELPYEEVKIRHLLTHKAGFPSYMWTIARHWHKPSTPVNEDLVEMLSEHPVSLRFEPGQKFNYSNTGYCLLASVVERVSGLSFDEFMKNRFFEPLNMDDTFAFSSAKHSYTPDMVKGYRYNGYNYNLVKLNLMDGTYGDKGIYATATDMVKWAESFRKNLVLDESIVSSAFSNSLLEDGEQIEYGYGFRIKESNDHEMIFHNGSWSGFRTTLRTFPHDGLTLVILSNNSFRKTGDMARKLTNTMFHDYEAGEVYSIVKSLLFEEKSTISDKSLSFVDSWEMHELMRVRQTVNHLDRRLLAHRIKTFTDNVSAGNKEYYALKEE